MRAAGLSEEQVQAVVESARQAVEVEKAAPDWQAVVAHDDVTYSFDLQDHYQLPQWHIELNTSPVPRQRCQDGRGDTGGSGHGDVQGSRGSGGGISGDGSGGSLVYVRHHTGRAIIDGNGRVSVDGNDGGRAELVSGDGGGDEQATAAGMGSDSR